MTLDFGLGLHGCSGQAVVCRRDGELRAGWVDLDNYYNGKGANTYNTYNTYSKSGRAANSNKTLDNILIHGKGANIFIHFMAREPIYFTILNHLLICS